MPQDRLDGFEVRDPRARPADFGPRRLVLVVDAGEYVDAVGLARHAVDLHVEQAAMPVPDGAVASTAVGRTAVRGRPVELECAGGAGRGRHPGDETGGGGNRR
jgi:hypothetical protein